MKRNVVAAAAITLVLGAVPVAHAAGPPVTASADCSAATFSTSGFPDGTNVFVDIGSQPPYGFTVGGYMWQFPSTEGGGTGTIPIGIYEQAHGFTFIIDTQQPGAPNVRWVDLNIACTAPAMPITPPTAQAPIETTTTGPTVTADVIARPDQTGDLTGGGGIPALTVVGSSPVHSDPVWANVELAPPW